MFNEQELLAALRQKEARAFATLFETYSDKLFRLAAGLLDDDDEAEGVVQDTFLRLFEKLDRFEGRASLGTWLYRVAYNASIDRLRQRRPQQPLITEEDSAAEDDAPFMPSILTDWSHAPEALFASAEAQAELERGIAALPDSLRVAFLLREVEGVSTAAAAEIMGIKEGAVKVRLHRARLLLREQLSGYFEELIALGSK